MLRQPQVHTADARLPERRTPIELQDVGRRYHVGSNERTDIPATLRMVE